MDEHARYDGEERRSRNGNGDWMASFPVWARALFILGPTAAIAIYLVYVGAQQIPAIAAQVKQNYTELLALKDMMVEHRLKQESIYRAVILDCVNKAANENARKNCFEQ